MKCEVELYEHAIRSAHCATQIEMEALEEAITLSWKSLTVKAPAPPSSLMERFVKKQESTPCQRNRTILNGGMRVQAFTSISLDAVAPVRHQIGVASVYGPF